MTLPTGETLPQYDDEHPEGVDLLKLNEWLVARIGGDWTISMMDQALIREVLAALQAVGDATLVKNGTYRAMRRDGADIERLTAWLANHGLTKALVEHGGNPVDTAITAITAARELVAKVGELLGKAFAKAFPTDGE